MTALERRVGGPGAVLSRGERYPQLLGAQGSRTLPGAQLDARGTVARRQALLRCLMSISPTLSLLATRDALLVVGPKTRQLRAIGSHVSSSVFLLLYSPGGARCGFRRTSVLANARLSSSRGFGQELQFTDSDS